MLHVKYRIQGGVVIHLQLPVLLEAPFPGKHLPPKTIESLHQVVALLNEDMMPFPIPLGMAFGRIEAIDLLGSVEELERENGEPVDDKPRRLGVQLRAWIRQGVLPQIVEQDGVAKLCTIVSPLVLPVDGTLRADDPMVARFRQARLIFGVPDVEIGKMVRKNRLQEVTAGLVDSLWQFGMPFARPAVVQNRDFSGR